MALNDLWNDLFASSKTYLNNRDDFITIPKYLILFTNGITVSSWVVIFAHMASYRGPNLLNDDLLEFMDISWVMSFSSTILIIFRSTVTEEDISIHKYTRTSKTKITTKSGVWHVFDYDGAVGSALGFGSRHTRSKPGHGNCVEALSPHRVTAVGKLLTFDCLGGDWPSFTSILTLLSSDCGLSVVSNKRILYIIQYIYIEKMRW